MIRYLDRLTTHALVVLVRYPLAPLLVGLFSSPDRRQLTVCRWMETIDNDLTGDEGWKEEHLWGADPLSFWNRVRWLWRNGGNAVSYGALGCPEPKWTRKTDDHTWVADSGHWLYRRKRWLTDTHWLDLFFGWNLLGPKAGRCKLVCTIRLKKLD